jgi:hypothetical protein
MMEGEIRDRDRQSGLLIMKKKRSLSYEELLRAGRKALERLAKADRLDGDTLSRCAHLARFFERVSQMGPADLKICDVLTEVDLQRIWRETQDDGAYPNIVERRPLIH